MNQRGKIQFTTILLLLGSVLAVWAAINYGPVYLDNMTARQTTTQYLSRFTAADKRGDLDLKTLYINELNRIGSHEETDAYGAKKVVTGLGIKPEMVTMNFDNVTGIATVGVEYDRTFQLWPLKKWKTLHFQIMKEAAFKR